MAIDPGDVRELAAVRLTGRALGVVLSPPFRVELTGNLRPTGNELEVDVVNFGANGVIGDQTLPGDRHFTRTNVRRLTADTPLTPSGLLGPVRLVERDP